MNVSRIKAWKPGWPWELELLAFVFVVTAIAIPMYLQYYCSATENELSLMAQAAHRTLRADTSWSEMTNLMWAVAIVGIYLSHLMIASTSSEWISTPFTHLFAPFVFATITYARLLKISCGTHTMRIVTGSALEITSWVIGVLSITFLLARIRMARHMVKLRDIAWDITTPTKTDITYLTLLAYFRPLIYPPREYRVSQEGILIEGWFYVMPIPFEVISTIEPVKSTHLISSAYVLATSARNLIRIHLLEHPEPIFISPARHDEFLSYCNRIIAPRRPGTRAGDTSAGTRSQTTSHATTQQPAPDQPPAANSRPPPSE